MRAMLILVAVILASGCQVHRSAAAEPLAVKIPRGFQAVTKAQQKLTAEVQRLSRGMTKAEVKERLGRPADESADLLFYNRFEDASGGNYVTAKLVFDKQGLAEAELGFGHVSLEP